MKEQLAELSQEELRLFGLGAVAHDAHVDQQRPPFRGDEYRLEMPLIIEFARRFHEGVLIAGFDLTCRECQAKLHSPQHLENTRQLKQGKYDHIAFRAEVEKTLRYHLINDGCAFALLVQVAQARQTVGLATAPVPP